MTDIIDHLAGNSPKLAALRAHRPVARAQAQASHDALFSPADPGDFPVADRKIIAAFIAGIMGEAEMSRFYATGLDPLIQSAIATGPKGAYPEGPLTAENTDPPVWSAPADLPPKRAAALTHAHMLVFHPRDAAPHHLQALYDAGWSTDGIVTLSQFVAFISFQIRTAAGLRVLESTL